MSLLLRRAFCPIGATARGCLPRELAIARLDRRSHRVDAFVEAVFRSGLQVWVKKWWRWVKLGMSDLEYDNHDTVECHRYCQS